jgi:enediyne biosynthesis protein E4
MMVVVGAVIYGCNGRPKGEGKETPLPVAPEDLAIPVELRDLPRDAKDALIRDSKGQALAELFHDLTADSGVNATYHNGQEAGHLAILESLGGGAGLIDYDGDGLFDIFVTGGGYYDGPDKKQIKGHSNHLFKNLGNWKFKEVTREAGLDQPLFYTHGCAVADYDRDGWPDLLVTGWGRVVLYHNEPDGKGGRRFRDVSKEAGLAATEIWSTSAAWADFDGDGFPDFYVDQYVNWSFKNNPHCGGYTASVPHDVCPPKQFKGQPHHLFRNNGNGTFSDVSKEAGLRPYTGDKNKEEPGKGLGVVVADLNGDGKPDIYVANDTVDNFLYINQSTPGKIRFEEVGLPSGVARDDRGIATGSMGTDVGDYDGSGRPSIWVANYENELHSLFRNLGKDMFIFSTPASGIAAIGQLHVGFGTGFVDLDNDGLLDLVVANGHVIRYPTISPLQQRPVLMRNRGNGKFTDITRQGGEYFRTDHIGRGIAIGDIDNDGKPDLVISHVNEPVSVLRNVAEAGNHWLGLRLEGKAHRDIVGAKIVVEVDGKKLTGFSKGGSSYLSARDPRLLFGLGKATKIDKVTVTWPWTSVSQAWDGRTFSRTDAYWKLIEGKADPAQAK